MKILMINVVCGIRSTGRICTDLALALEAQGHEVKIAYGREKVPPEAERFAVRIGNDREIRLHVLKARMTDGCGLGSRAATTKFIGWVKAYNPDIIHLHNLHGYYLHTGILFDYLRGCGKKIIWTLHDCWAFTGHAGFCEAAGCERWKTGCHDCPNRNTYPASVMDRSRQNWERKKRILTGIPNLTIVTPSKWLAGLVQQSFLKAYPVRVIPNGVDLSVFRPRTETEAVRKRLGTGGRKIVLGVAALWEKRKGLEDFVLLSKGVDQDTCIVLVGLSKEQARDLPPELIAVERTNSREELAELYAAAEVYVNPTYEDNYPTTNLEAIACGTPVITYDTGGSGESAAKYGTAVAKGDLEGLLKAIRNPEGFTNTWRREELGIPYFCEQYLGLYF